MNWIWIIIFFKFVNGVQRPNVVVLLADDLGRGSLPSYGNKDEKTPNIVRLFQEGVKFDHLLSPAALCTPSRSAFLTGRHPFELGLGEGSYGPPVIVYAASKVGLPKNESTWASVAQNLGYATKAIGKWHVGMDENVWGDQEHGPLTHGFDSFYGLPFTVVKGFEGDQPFWTLTSHSSKVLVATITLLALTYKRNYKFIFLLFLCFPLWIMTEHFDLFSSHAWWKRSLWMERYLNSYLMSNTTVIERPIQLRTLAQRLTTESIKFIRQNADVKPFLLYHAFHNLHDPQCVSEEFIGKGTGTPYSDSLVEMDYQIGQILDLIDELGISDNTIIFFTSDHGKLGLNVPFRGGKGAVSLEGGVRIPGAIRWPSMIPGGKVIREPTSLLDFYPTLLDILDVRADSTKKLDGESFHGFMTTNQSSGQPRMIQHTCGTELHALRHYDGRGSVIKAIFVEEDLDSLSRCRGGVCLCANARLLPPTQMKILNVTTEGHGEKCSPDYETTAREMFLKVHKEYSKKIKPTQQLNSFLKVMPLYPRLNPGVFYIKGD